MRILIAGGGIGGLVTALALHTTGADVRIFESAEEIRPLGVGINLLPHAVRELTSLGLADQLAAAGIPTSELVYFNKHGQHIWSEPRGRAAGYPWPQYSIHRGCLQMLLLEAVHQRIGEGAVRVGEHLSSFHEQKDGVVATFTSRARGRETVESGDALVGADGIHSVVRPAFYPHEGEPCFSGRLLWRAITESEPFLTGCSMIMAGHANQKFVAYPICPAARAQGRSIVNWVAELCVGGEVSPTKRNWNRQVHRDVFAAAFREWRFDWLDIPGLIEAAETIFEFPMVDRNPLPRWTFGRVTLLGDAAHPMYPIGSNGASQAILDAAALRRAVELSSDIREALCSYETQRLGPTAAIVHSNRQQGPEVVMQMAEERAPGGFRHIEDVIAPEELREISERYKRIAGFDQTTLQSLQEDRNRSCSRS